MEKIGRDYPDGVLGGKTGGGSHVADRGSYTEREEGAQGDWVGGGHLEGRGGDPTFPATAGIKFHDAATLEAKMLQQLASMREEFL